MVEIIISKLLDEIKEEAIKIDDIYKEIDTHLKAINGYKMKIRLKDELSDDFKFYNGIIDNIFIYYNKSKDIRLNKLSKDIKSHCKIINLHNDLEYDIFFSIKNINSITDKYKLKIKNKKDEMILNKNKFYWMKDSDLNTFEEWPKKLYYLMKYHLLIIEFLLEALKIEHIFLKAQKDDSIDIRSNTFNTSLFDSYTASNIIIIANKQNIKSDSILKSLFKTKKSPEILKKSPEILKKEIESLQKLITELLLQTDDQEKIELNDIGSQTYDQKEVAFNDIGSQIDDQKEIELNDIESQTDDQNEIAFNDIGSQTDGQKEIALNDIGSQIDSKNEIALNELVLQKDKEREIALSELVLQKDKEREMVLSELKILIDKYKEDDKIDKNLFITEILTKIKE